MTNSKSFGITIRTRVGINEQFSTNFDRWIKKQPFGAFVYEKEAHERHIHAQIWLAEPRTKGNVMKPLRKMVERCYQPDEYVLKHAICIKPAYNDDFIEEYCQKDGNLEYAKIPDSTTDYYPTEEEQAKFLEMSENKKNWTLWKELSELWDEHGFESINEYTVSKFLAEMMFVKKLIKVEMDDRKRRQMCTTFTAYLSNDGNGMLFLPKEKKDMYEIYISTL